VIIKLTISLVTLFTQKVKLARSLVRRLKKLGELEKQNVTNILSRDNIGVCAGHQLFNLALAKFNFIAIMKFIFKSNKNYITLLHMRS
jgi:hypothetical protein